MCSTRLTFSSGGEAEGIFPSGGEGGVVLQGRMNGSNQSREARRQKVLP